MLGAGNRGSSQVVPPNPGRPETRGVQCPVPGKNGDAVKEQEEPQNGDPVVQEPAETSLDELIAKKSDEGATGEGEEETPATAPGREERVETLSVKVVPQQPTEFVCKNCFLVKHRSQLADKKRMFCRDCV
jgi:hypothetical protein